MLRSVVLVLLLTMPAMAQRPYCGKIVANLPAQTIKIGDKVYRGPVQDCGSFVIVSDDHVLTNAHNVRDHLRALSDGEESSIELRFATGATRVGTVLDVDEGHDLALVGFQGLPEGLHRIGVGTKPGQVLTIGGYPGCGVYTEKTVKGYNEEDNRYPWAFKFPGVFEVGFSGSPVINSNGYLVGLLWGSDAAPGNERPFGYATRVDKIRKFLKKNGILFD